VGHTKWKRSVPETRSARNNKRSALVSAASRKGTILDAITICSNEDHSRYEEDLLGGMGMGRILFGIPPPALNGSKGATNMITTN
jgi:hypothetical protein